VSESNLITRLWRSDGGARVRCPGVLTAVCCEKVRVCRSASLSAHQCTVVPRLAPAHSTHDSVAVIQTDHEAGHLKSAQRNAHTCS